MYSKTIINYPSFISFICNCVLTQTGMVTIQPTHLLKVNKLLVHRQSSIFIFDTHYIVSFFAFKADRITFGRNADNDVRFTERCISGKHCVIQLIDIEGKKIPFLYDLRCFAHYIFILGLFSFFLNHINTQFPIFELFSTFLIAAKNILKMILYIQI